MPLTRKLRDEALQWFPGVGPTVGVVPRLPTSMKVRSSEIEETPMIAIASLILSTLALGSELIDHSEWRTNAL